MSLILYSRLVEVVELDDVLAAVVVLEPVDEVPFVALELVVWPVLLKLDEDDDGGRHCE